MAENKLIPVNIETEIDILKTGLLPAIQSHRERASKALSFGQSLIDTYNKTGEMTPELDAKFKDYLIKVADLNKDLKSKREIYTKTFDLIREQFTSVENAIDIKKQDTIIYDIQKIRNDYATAIALAEKNRLAEIAKQEAKKQEIITLRAELEKQFNSYFNKYLTDKKLQLNGIFNDITLNTFNEKSEWLTNLKFAYDLKHLASFRYAGTCTLDDKEFIDLFNETLNPLGVKAQETYKLEMLDLQAQLIELLPSKRNELVTAFEFEQEQIKAKAEQERIELEQKTANEAQMKLLEAQKKENDRKIQEAKERQEFEDKARLQREQEEKARIEADAKAKELKQRQEIEAKAETDKVLSLFDSEMQVADKSELPKSKEGFESSLVNSAGALELFMYWFNNEGSKWDIERLSKKLEWIFTYANKQALKNEKVTSNFKMVKFTPVFKADTRKK